MYSKFLLLIAALFAATLWSGCDDEQPLARRDGIDPVGSIQIVTSAPGDTLFFLHSTFPTTNIIVILTDTRGLTVAGVKIDVALANPELGVIEYADQQLRDTTNSMGRVLLVFHGASIEGDEVITAEFEDAAAHTVLAIRQFDFATFTAEVTLNVDTVYVDQWVQPILQMRVLSDGRIPVPDLVLPYAIPEEIGGIPQFPNIGPTDLNGYAESPLPLYPWSTAGTYCVGMVFTWQDSVCVVLR